MLRPDRVPELQGGPDPEGEGQEGATPTRRRTGSTRIRLRIAGRRIECPGRIPSTACAASFPMHPEPLPLIAFDEAGNTGPDLLSADQPVFALASVQLADADAKALLSKFSTNAAEVKFVNLRKTTRGRAQLLDFFSQHLDSSRFKATLTHKEYVVAAKMVDLLLEPMLHRDGVDLYANGGNIAMANVLHGCLPTLVGPHFRELQSRFVAMIRIRDDTSIDAFYAACSDAYVRCANSPASGLLAAILASSDLRSDFKSYAASELDPAIPSFVQHCAMWGEHLGTLFDLVHDDSKPIAQSRELLTMLMPQDEPTVTVGADRRTFQLPLKATGIRFARSCDVLQLQLADLVASSVAFLGRNRATGAGDGSFAQALVDAGLLKVVFDGLWPSLDVDPVDLGTQGADAEPLMDQISSVIGSYMRKRTM